MLEDSQIQPDLSQKPKPIIESVILSETASESVAQPAEPIVPEPVELASPPTEPSAPPQESQPATAPASSPTPASSPSTIESPRPPMVSQVEPSPKSFLAKALDAIQFRKKAKLEKIMKLAQEKRSVTNDQVQKLLRVSDATATRYLSELVRQARLRQFGIRGSARYEPIVGSIPTI